MQAQFKEREVVVPEYPENFRHRSNTDDLVHFWSIASVDLLQRLDTGPVWTDHDGGDTQTAALWTTSSPEDQA
jgi:hypothetical protein